MLTYHFTSGTREWDPPSSKTNFQEVPERRSGAKQDALPEVFVRRQPQPCPGRLQALHALGLSCKYAFHKTNRLLVCESERWLLVCEFEQFHIKNQSRDAVTKRTHPRFLKLIDGWIDLNGTGVITFSENPALLKQTIGSIQVEAWSWWIR